MLFVTNFVSLSAVEESNKTNKIIDNEMLPSSAWQKEHKLSLSLRAQSRSHTTLTKDNEMLPSISMTNRA